MLPTAASVVVVVAVAAGSIGGIESTRKQEVRLLAAASGAPRNDSEVETVDGPSQTWLPKIVVLVRASLRVASLTVKILQSEAAWKQLARAEPEQLLMLRP